MVCIKHFDKCFIIKDSVSRLDGSALTLKSDRLKLTKEAFSTNFKNVPAYLSKEFPALRKDIAKQQEEIEKRQEER